MVVYIPELRTGECPLLGAIPGRNKMLSSITGWTLAEGNTSSLPLGSCVCFAVRVSVGPGKYHGVDSWQSRQHVLGHIPEVNIIVSVHRNSTQSSVIGVDVTLKVYQRVETGAKEQCILTEVDEDFG